MASEACNMKCRLTLLPFYEWFLPNVGQPARISTRKRGSNCWIHMHFHRKLLGHCRDLQAVQMLQRLVVCLAMKDLMVAIPCSSTLTVPVPPQRWIQLHRRMSASGSVSASIAKDRGIRHIYTLAQPKATRSLDCTGTTLDNNIPL